MDKLNVRFMTYITVVITVIMTLSMAWNNRWQSQQALDELREKSSIIAKQFLATREFIAINQTKINSDSQGHFEFKHLNPATVGKGVGDIFARFSDYRIKQTRLHVRNPENAPDAFEERVLKKFAASSKGPKEYWGVDEAQGKKVFRYMIPLYIDNSCLQCHGSPKGQMDISGHRKEGYKTGEYAGAISIITPMDSYQANTAINHRNQLFFTIFLIIAILGAIDILIRKLVSRPLNHLTNLTNRVGQGNLDVQLTDFKAHGEIKDLGHHFRIMAEQLKDLYSSLELKVVERTLQLSEANELLELQRVELLKYNQELIKANQLKSEFLANMSHELRTPLTAIIAFSELLLSQISGAINRQQQDNLQEILDSSNRLLNMINDLLDLAKIEAGKIQLQPELTDIAEIIYEVERNLLPLANKKSLLINSKIAPDLPLLILDPERIRQVLMNLVGNAIKFTPLNGEITITVNQNQAVSPFEIQVGICDTGIGISPHDLDKIFEKFHQVDSSPTRQYKGSGLGLTLAKTFIELHNGRIWAESELGKGSTFYFTLSTALYKEYPPSLQNNT